MSSNLGVILRQVLLQVKTVKIHGLVKRTEKKNPFYSCEMY